jgi:hypothetical protein
MILLVWIGCPVSVECCEVPTAVVPDCEFKLRLEFEWWLARYVDRFVLRVTRIAVDFFKIISMKSGWVCLSASPVGALAGSSPRLGAGNVNPLCLGAGSAALRKSRAILPKANAPTFMASADSFV